MPVLRTPLGLTADCSVCKRFFREGVFDGTSHELIHAMRAENWTTQPVVCGECADKMHVWRNEGQPADKNPVRRKKEKLAAAATRRRRSATDLPPKAEPVQPAVNPSPRRRRRTLI